MQTSELNKPPTQRRRRRRRPKNRRKQKERDESSTQSVLQTKKNLDLTDLASEAHALEKQLTSLKKQLSINYSSMPSKEQGRMANAIAAEQISTTEEEINYVRKSLKVTYRRIFAIDLIYATTHFIEEKLWGFIFYAEIEQVRSKLRKSPDANEIKVLQKELYRRIDSAFKFYRELNSHVKSVYHIDTKMLGIELLEQKGEEKVGTLLQFNYICMGDLARYNAQQAMAAKSKKKTAEFWSLAKTCYLKAMDVYRENGKPYSQLALVSIYNGNAMDVVWYYCMSLAVKFPSSVGKDNLKSFYSKIKLNTKPKDHHLEDATSQLSQFVELFLHMHRTVMFSQKASEEFNTMMPLSSQLGTTLSFIIQSEQNQDQVGLSKSTTSLLHIVRTTLTRIITILMISIWITSERLKDNGEYTLRPIILASQIHLFTFTFHLLSGVYRSSRQALEQVRESLDSEKYQKLESMVDEALLPGLSIWASYLSTNTTAIAQYCTTASNDVRNREPEKKDLAKSVQSLLSIVISHSSFPDPVLNVLPPTYPLSEDLLLLGLLPLSRFHSKIDFFKETVYEAKEQTTSQARKQVRWGRIRDMIKKLADLNAFDFIQYNQTEQKYSVIDENAKRQQQGRFMKALATQRLIEQISSLEKNVDRMTLGELRNETITDRQVYTCVVDVTAFLDGLNKIKRWVTQPLNADRRTQPSIMEVVVPLEVLNSLDDLKKGTSSESRLVRESIRFLDQQSSIKMDVPHRSFLRIQKFDEKFDWQQVEQFWIGEESRSFADTILSEEEEDEHDENVESDQSSDSEIIKRRRGDDSDDSEEEEDEESESENEQDDKDEEFDYSEAFEEEEDDDEIPYTYEDVPKGYRTIINCMLYCLSKRQQLKETTSQQQKSLVLVTNDENLAWWAELFGDPKTGRRLQVETVDEWDKMVGKTIR